MKCRCIAPARCHEGSKSCSNDATDEGLCDVCALCRALSGPCCLPVVAPGATVLVPEIVQKDADVTGALDTAVAELGL